MVCYGIFSSGQFFYKLKKKNIFAVAKVASKT